MATNRAIRTVVLLTGLVSMLVILSLASGSGFSVQAADPAGAALAAQAIASALDPMVTGPRPEPFVLKLVASKDSWIEEERPDKNYGLELELTVGQQAVGVNHSVALVDFDLSSLPADAVPISATLELYDAGPALADAPQDPEAVRFLIEPRAITTSWLERQVTWNNRPGNSHLGDPVAEHVPGGWTVFDVSSIVQAWQAGSTPEYGFFLTIFGEATGTHSYEARTTAHPPELTIYYTRQTTLEANQDTWIDASHPSDSYGTDIWLRTASPNSSYGERLLLVGFDFASLPEDIAVISATLEMFTYFNLADVSSPSQVTSQYAEAMLSTWDEGLTWNDPHESLYLDDPPSVFGNLWNEWDVTNIARRWALDLDPKGILVRAGLESPLLHSFYSREKGSNPPKLTIAYGAAPPACNPVTSVQVSGVSTGVTGTPYTFGAVTLPADADPPDSVSWEVTDHGRLYGESVEVSWVTPGPKTLTVLVSHCGGNTSTQHEVIIDEPPPDCAIPLRGLYASGPLVVSTGMPYIYTAFATPSNTTKPITFTWQATDQGISVETTTTHISEQAYTWGVAGSKTLSVTAINCGGSATVYRGVEVVQPADLPDLTISTAWLEPGFDRIGYLVHNEGNTTAPAGFSVALLFQGTTPAATQHPTPVAPGGVSIGFLEYAWGCSSDFERVAVSADWDDVIAEVDEANNDWLANWDCDQQPPEITGPDILKLGETTADVHWSANERCDGWLEYGTSPYDSTPDSEPGDTGATEHNAQLTGLTAGTTYFVRAFCTDAAGLTSNTPAVSFETLPLGAERPRLRSLTLEPYPSTMYDFWDLVLEMEDDPYMDRVEFAMDGYLVGLDYGGESSGGSLFYHAYLSPAAMGLSREEFFRRHTFQATAFRQHPDGIGDLIEDLTPVETDPEVTVVILEPHNLHRIYIEDPTVPAGTVLDVSVRAAAFDWHCTWGAYTEGVVPPGQAGVDCDDLTQQEAESVTLWIDGTAVDTATPAPGEFLVALQAPIGGLGTGSHEIEVVAMASGVSDADQITFIVEQGEPDLEVSRSVRREGTTLKVTLDLHNAGSLDARVVKIYDNIVGLQQANATPLSDDYWVGTSGWDWVTPDSALIETDVLIRFNIPGDDGMMYVTIPPGGDYSVSYVAMPILYEELVMRSIGEQAPVTVELVEEGRITRSETFDLPCMVVDDPAHGLVPVTSAVIYAVREADYILVTNPRRAHDILWNHGLSDVPQIFVNMAELASLKNGVLGFLFTYDDKDVLDDLIEPGNYWAESLAPIFKEVDQGYVLIVGETEIVVSNYVGGNHFFTGPGIVEHTHDSDLWYANTYGETARPELVVGRVIGNTAEDINIYLENVIAAARGEPGHGFNRSRALLISGMESRHENNVNHVADQMENEIADVNRVHWRHWDEDWSSARLNTKPKMPDNGIIFFNGHGNTQVWEDGALASDFRSTASFYDLGNTTPAVFAASCKTGNYEGGNDISIAEAVLEAGAGAYIGSVESTESSSTTDAFRRLYSRWATDESMGQALNQMKRAIWELDLGYDHRKLWAFTSNLYGDPKYGRLEEAMATQDAGESLESSLELIEAPETTTIKLKLPDVEFYRTEEGDHVELPGAGPLAEYGGYPVPVWLTTVDYRPGRSVQDVQLVLRGQPTAYSGLSLPINQGIHEDDPAPAGAAALATSRGWFPELEQVYDWSVEERPDGSTTLEIRIFPFYYNPRTTDALFYQTFQFSVEYIDTTVAVESLQAGPGPYEPRDPVDLQLVVSNSSTLRPPDVIIQASVRTMGTNRILGGLPLKTLHSLQGTATVDLVWDTRGYEAGEYQIVVELLDIAGRLLDTGVTEVELGTVSAQLTGLAASQETFAPGDAITLRMGVKNTGSAPLDGTGMFWIQSATDLAATEVLTVPFAALAPGATAKLSGVWDTRGVEGYDFRVLAYAKFRSQATDPLALSLYRPRVFLPLVMRTSR